MKEENGQKLFFVVNPTSGGEKKVNSQVEITHFFKGLPHSIEFYSLTGKNDATSLRHHISLMNPEKLVAVGGDGTVKLVAEVASQTKIPMGIIPMGSANGLAKEFSIPSNLGDAFEIILNGTPKTIDTIRINNNENCIHLSDIGLNARLIKYSQQSAKRGMWSYAKALISVLWNKRFMHALITTDTATFSLKAYMIVIANANKYGTGATINPVGKIDDGLFELVIVKKFNVLSLVKLLTTRIEFDPSQIEVLQTQHAEITLLKNTDFQVDGEYRGKVKLVTASVEKDSCKLLLPSPYEL